MSSVREASFVVPDLPSDEAKKQRRVASFQQPFIKYGERSYARRKSSFSLRGFGTLGSYGPMFAIEVVVTGEGFLPLPARVLASVKTACLDASILKKRN